MNTTDILDEILTENNTLIEKMENTTQISENITESTKIGQNDDLIFQILDKLDQLEYLIFFAFLCFIMWALQRKM